MKRKCYPSLVSDEKQLRILLNRIIIEKELMVKTYKNCSSDKEKFLFIMGLLVICTYDEFLGNLLYLDSSLTYEEAKKFIKTNSQKLLKKSKIGLVKNKGEYGFYILCH